MSINKRDSRLTRQGFNRALPMADKRLGVFDARFHPPEPVHHVVVGIEFVRVLTDVGVTGGALSRLGGGDIHVLRRIELLRLGAGHHFEIIKLERLPEPKPGVINKERGGTVVRMRVHGPVRKNQVGLQTFQQLAKLPIARRIDFRVAVNLPGKDGRTTLKW